MQSDNYLRKRMELDVLTAISPIDGRYRGKTKALAAYFSEFALIKYRVQVEVEYFITLCELPLPLVNTNFFSFERDSLNSNPSQEKLFRSSGFSIRFFRMNRVISPRDILIYITIEANFPFVPIGWKEM